MKKRILIMISAIILIISSLSVYGRDLGQFVGGPDLDWIMVDGKAVLVSTFYWQFGIRIHFSNGWDPIEYVYGAEDIPNFAKMEIEIISKNDAIVFDENVYVDVFGTNYIANPILKLNGFIKGNVGDNLQNLNLNLEKGKLYIVVFRDEKGTILDVKKVMLTE